MQITIALGDVNPGAGVEAGVFALGQPLSRGSWGRGFSWNVKIFQFPKLSKLEPLCVLWPHFKSLADC